MAESRPAVFTLNSATEPAAICRSRPSAEQTGGRGFAKRADRDVLADVHLRKHAQPLAVFGHQRDARPAGFGRMTERDRPAVEQHFARRRRLRRTEQAFQQFGAAGAHQAGECQESRRGGA